MKTPKLIFAKTSKRVHSKGIKAIHVFYLCIPMGLLLIAAAVFLLNHSVGMDENSTKESLQLFNKWLHISIPLPATPPTASSTDTFVSDRSSKSSTSISNEVTLNVQQAVVSTNATGEIPNPKQNSKYAYVTLISGIDSSFKYRGFLYNALIMKKSLADSGSVADFVALIGFSEPDSTPFEQDMNLLRSKGIITYILPRLVDSSHKLSFAEMALLKITPWSFTQYRRIQFFDGDVMPTRNMDCFFLLGVNTFTIGAVSPLNSGWYLAIPEAKAYEYMLEKAKWRLARDWEKEVGWASKDPHLPAGLTVRGGLPCAKQWDFNGADMDQGLLTHYYVLNYGNVMLIDSTTRSVVKYAKGLLREPGVTVPIKKAIDCCNGGVPTSFFVHFTGRQKPWMVPNIGSLEPAKKNSDLIRWTNMLDSLELPINSKTVGKLGLGSPLGFWNHNFPKGGFGTPGKGKNLRGHNDAGDGV